MDHVWRGGLRGRRSLTLCSQRREIDAQAAARVAGGRTHGLWRGVGGGAAVAPREPVDASGGRQSLGQSKDLRQEKPSS
jgi:hypothetical protein